MASKQWRLDHPDEARAYARKQRRAYRAVHPEDRARQKRQTVARNKARLRVLKESTACEDCGRRYPHYVMDFDHVAGKARNVSAMMAWGWRGILQEVAKCDLVCSNCHRIRTHLRRLGEEMGRRPLDPPPG